jgi:hypothetical protein
MCTKSCVIGTCLVFGSAMLAVVILAVLVMTQGPDSNFAKLFNSLAITLRLLGE